MGTKSGVYQLYCELINDIYINAHDVDEALNIIQKLSDLIDILDPDKRILPPDKSVSNDFLYFPSESE